MNTKSIMQEGYIIVNLFMQNFNFYNAMNFTIFTQILSLAFLRICMYTRCVFSFPQIEREGSIPLVIFLGFIDVLCGLSLGKSLTH